MKYWRLKTITGVAIKKEIYAQNLPEIMLQNGNNIYDKYFKPKQISVGPLHADDSNLLKEELKVKLVAKFIRSYGDRKREESVLNEIRDSINVLKNLFGHGVKIESYDNDFLARLFFLDGCAVLQLYIAMFTMNWKSISNGQADLIAEDSFLLENQIPYSVLKMVLKLVTVPQEFKLVKIAILKFVQKNNMIAPANFSDYLTQIVMKWKICVY